LAETVMAVIEIIASPKVLNILSILQKSTILLMFSL